MSGKSVASAPVRAFFLLLVTCAVAGCGSGDDRHPPVADATPRFAGSVVCGECHQPEFDAWQNSHHALAMQHASAATVLGDFTGTEFSNFGVTSTFFRQGETFFVRTDNAEGELQDFPVKYVFGVEPLQQYLVEFPGGRLQALSIAWDSRPAAEGGQRWFHLYPDEPIRFDDALHWTGRAQNWNYMCAECHSTELIKHYDVASDSFDTTWFEINVGCEGCHGPASRHVAQAEAGDFRSRAGLVVDLDDAGRATWEMNVATGIAERSEVRMRPPVQPEACGRCHARRSITAEHYEYGRPLLDTHLPSLLDDSLYFPDGQIQDEVYVYGSFLQSRMYRTGVSCTDCHDPHTARLRTAGAPSNVCSTCHLPAKFDNAGHHRHAAGSVACVDCHMASRNYMVVDGRRDHSFRIPRPDLTIATGSPNACSQCHEDRDADWAARAITDWYGDDRPGHYGLAIHAGRTGGGNQPLLAAIANSDFPGIARGTALSLLRPPYSRQVAEVIRDASQNGDPFVRLGALLAMPGLQPELQVDWAAPLLSDRLRSLRVAAAHVVSPLRDRLHVRFEAPFEAAERELRDSFLAIAERPEAWINLGNLYLEAGDARQAEAAFRQSLNLAPASVGATVNLADLYRRLDQDDTAESLLRLGLQSNPGEASYRHALGLLLVRQQKHEDGLAELGAASELAPDNARYAYVYAVALNSLGQSDAAIAFLSSARQRFPGDFDVHWALATMLRDQGRLEEATAVATELARVYPGVAPLQNLLQAL
jgi:tetratricopeptide (TPR) repeat protein